MLDQLRSHPDRFLLDHLNGTARRAMNKATSISWEPFRICKERAVKFVELCALCHDFAKASKDFQDYISDLKRGKHTNHAPLSSLVTYHVLKENGFDSKLSSFGYFIVRNHHEHLKNFEFCDENLPQLEKQLERIPTFFIDWFQTKTNCQLPTVKDMHDKLSSDLAKLTLHAEFTMKDYIMIHTLMAILTSSDHEDAALEDVAVSVNPKLTIDLINQYIEHIPKDNKLYSLRKQFHEDINQSLGKIDGRILSVTAPTGLGKTLANLKIALSKAKDDSIIVYALPFINIIDQTFETLQRILNSSDYDATTILPYHHLTDAEYKNKDYEKISIQQVLVENWHSQVVVTTFVSLFESLLTNKRTPFFYKLLNSVIILDEVQSIPHKYWGPISEILKELTEFGATVILSTATQPMILDKTQEIVKKNYTNELNRTKVYFRGDVDLAQFFKIVEQTASETFKNQKSLLVVVNTIRESKELYNYLRQKFGPDDLFYLSSNVIPKQRMERIKKLKQLKGKPSVCVSTQVVEAGVDISFDRIIRDQGPLDSIIQVSGRCNRTFENQMGEVEIYTVIEQEKKRSFASYIYDSFLIDITKEVTSQKESFEEKEFDNLVSQYFDKIKKRGNTDQENLIELMKSLEFEKIGTQFHLIDRKYEVVTVYVEYDENAVRLREKLNEVMKDQSLEKFEKLAKIKKLLKQMSLYTIDVPITRDDLTGALTIENGFVVITNDNLNYWYKDETGFERGTSTMIF